MAFLGVDIGGQFAKLALVGVGGKILARDRVPTTGMSAEEVFADIGAKLPGLVARRKLSGVGVACAGLVDPVAGRVLESPNMPKWRNAPIRRIARQALGVQVCIENDANAAALGEYRIGIGRGSHVFVLITLGTGVGGGIVCDGRILRGDKNFAGEIGHMAVSQKGPKCRCGNRGCLEAYLGTYALVRDARRRLRSRRSSKLHATLNAGGSLSPKLLGRAARSGDAVANAVFADAGQHLGVALASLVNLLNPGVIAIGGGVSAEFALLAPTAKAVVRQRAFGPSSRAVKIARAKLGNDAATIGVALLARDKLQGSRRP